MSDWKSRSRVVGEEKPAGDWKSRSTVVGADQPAAPEKDAFGLTKPRTFEQLSPEEQKLNPPDLVHARSDAFLKGNDAKAKENITGALAAGANWSGMGAPIAGGINAIGEGAKSVASGEMPHPLDAYRSGRDKAAQTFAMADKEHPWAGPLGAAVTTMGVGGPATAGGRIALGAALGGVPALAKSKADLTSGKLADYYRAAKDTGVGAGLGAATAGAFEAVPALASAAKSVAPSLALKAAGLSSGITNQAQKWLGVKDVAGLKGVGQKMLDEKLIPWNGNVGKAAEAAQGRSGPAIDAALAKAQSSGVPLDHAAIESAALTPLVKASTVAEDAGGKLKNLAALLGKQGTKTPNDWAAMNRAKSDAWKSANFKDDAPVAAQLYRQGVGAARDDLERQVGNAAGKDVAADLSKANSTYGTAADALKLVNNEETRAAAKQSALLRGFRGAVGGGAGYGLGHALGGPTMGAAFAAAYPTLEVLASKYGPAFGANIANKAAPLLRAASPVAESAADPSAAAVARYLSALREDHEK